MNDRRFRLVLMWNGVLTALLLVSLAGNAMWAQAASDPPVKVAFGTFDDIGGYGTNTSSIVVNNPNYDTIVRAKIKINEGEPHTCVATASAFTFSDPGATHDYAIAMDTPTNPNIDSKRQVFTNNNRAVEVTTVQGFQNVSGNRTFHLSTRGTPAATVFNRGIIVVCIKNP